MNENVKVTGRLKVELIRDGVVVQSMERDNIVTTAGKNSLASLINSASAGNTWVTYMGFGTSTTAVAATDTALGTELTIGTNGYNRASVTVSNPASNQVQYVATLTGLTASTTIQEAGLFNASSAGTLVAHQLTGAVALQSSSDSLKVTWTITIG